MKTFNTTGLLFSMAMAFLNSPLQAQATDQRFIEVTVSDTAAVVPDRIEYTLSLRATYAYATEMPYGYDEYPAEDPASTVDQKKREEEEKLKLKMNEKRLAELLNKEKISFTRSEKKNTIDLFPSPRTQQQVKPFIIVFPSFVKMQEFIDKIPEDLKYDGNVSGVSSSQTTQLEQRLIEKLLKKAREQAGNIARLSEVKLGHLMVYTDNTDNDLVKGLEQLLTSFMSKYEREKFLEFYRGTVLRKTIRVRFAIE